MIKQVLTATAFAALVGCGGGGGGSGGGFAAAPVASASPPAAPVAVQEPATPPSDTKLSPLNPGCTMPEVNHVACEMIASDQLIGAALPPDVYITFTNNTGTYLQINSIHAQMADERLHWSEYCAFLDAWHGQDEAGIGEIGCKSKPAGQLYEPVLFGSGTGLSVPPGSVVIIGPHTEPEQVEHTFALDVKVQTTGLKAWRQPRQDEMIPCNDQMQSTSWMPWTNTSDRDMHLSGASIYAESAKPETPNTLSGACIFVLDASGATKYQNCDVALRTRGDVSFPVVTFAPGESVVAQAINSCSTGGTWDFVSYLRVW